MVPVDIGMAINSRKGSVHLPFAQSIALLRKSGVDFCNTGFVDKYDEQAAVAMARKAGFPAVLKVVSSPTGEAAVHKEKEGLVAVADSPESLVAAYNGIAASHARLVKKNLIEKRLVVAVQEKVSGVECFVGIKRDQLFGSVVLFGSGGVLAEELGDIVLRLCPISHADATRMIAETRVYAKIAKVKDPGGLLQKLSALIVNVSKLALEHPEISELDLNPIFVDGLRGRVLAVDFRAVASKAAALKKPKGMKKESAHAGSWKELSAPNFFSPMTVAVIGASRDTESVGHSIMRNLTIGCVHRCEYCRPFLGRIFPVNPFASEILGLKSYPSILAVPDNVDLAIIAVPHQIVPKAVDECIKKKVKAVIIISAGFGEFNEEGRKLQAKIVERLEKARIPLLGPNCLGIIAPRNNLNASFGPSTPPKGDVAFISQSGALADSIIDWSIQARYGFSVVVSYGNKAMLDCYDFFSFLANDEETKSVAIYIEGVNNGRDFFDSLKKLVMKKPVVILKGGRTGSGVSAAATHTASLAGDVKVFEAAAMQAGAVLAETVEELFDVAKVLAEQPVCRDNGIGIITNGGGCGVICSDYCEELGVKLPQLQKSVLKTFDSSGIMHPAYSRRNPLDIVGDALPNRYELAINTLLNEPYINGLIIIQTLQAMTNSVLNAKVIVEAHKQFPGKPIISCFMGGRFSRKGMHYLENMRIPDFNDIRKAVVAMKALISRGEYLAKSDAGKPDTMPKPYATAATKSAEAKKSKRKKKK